MTAPLSSKELYEIRDLCENAALMVGKRTAFKLLAEVDRLRAGLAFAKEWFDKSDGPDWNRTPTYKSREAFRAWLEAQK